MAAAAIFVRRARSAGRIFREVHGQTGSITAAVLYVARLAASKMLRQLRRRDRRGTQRRHTIQQVRATRADLPADIPLVAVLVSGGLGDYLVIARFLRDLDAECGPLAFDIFASNPDQARWVFGALKAVIACRDEISYEIDHSEYNLVLRANLVVTVERPYLALQGVRERPALRSSAEHIERAAVRLKPLIDQYPHWANFLAQTFVYENRNRTDSLHGMAGIGYGGDAFPIQVDDAAVARYGLRRGNYITLHNGFDPQFFVQNGRATKCYPHFGMVVRLLKRRFPELPIVQLGTTTSDPVPEADLNLIGATSLKEASGLVANALLHIDNEGGLVHLARCLGVPSCVVFGPTPADFFGYAGNINISPSFCGGCWWVSRTWMDKCPRGFDVPRCMSELDPGLVADTIGKFLDATPSAMREVPVFRAAD